NAGLNVPTNIYGNDTLGNNPSVPAYIWPNPCGTKKVPAPCTNVDTSTYKFPDALIMPGSAGTDWWKAVFGTGEFRNANLAASGKAVGLSNLTNPLKIAYSGQNNIATNDRMFGNVFGGFDAHHGISLKTRFGFNLSQNSYHGFSPTTPENSEVTSVDGINENY